MTAGRKVISRDAQPPPRWRSGLRPSLQMDALEAHGIDPEIIDLWRREVGERLLPVQERAVKGAVLVGDGNVVVCSPPQSGKSFIGEMVAAKTAATGTRVLYLVSDGAQAMARFEELRPRYEPAGIELVVSTEECSEFDRQVRQRQFEVAIVSVDKLWAMLASQPGLMSAFGLAVLDDTPSGVIVQALLAKVASIPKAPRIVCLSDRYGWAREVAGVLDARLIAENRRPVELREGVLCDGEFHFCEHNSGASGVEAFQQIASRNRQQLVAGAAAELVHRGEQVLVLVPDAAVAASVAFEVADQVEEDLACGDLGAEEHTSLGKELALPLRRRVAFHHAGLSRSQRESLVRGFEAGAIRALVVAPVLGVDRRLRAANVVVDGRVWRSHGADGERELVELTRSEYETVRGHAAPATADCCRVILVTHSCSQAEDWMGRYHGAQADDEGPTASSPIALEDRILDVVAVGLAKRRTELPSALRKTFWGESHGYVEMPERDFLRAIRLALNSCVRAQLITQETSGQLVVTELGKAASVQRMSVKTAGLLAAWASSVPNALPDPVEIISLLGQTADGTTVHVHLSEGEERNVDFRAKLLACTDRAGVSQRQTFNSLKRWQSPLSVVDAGRAKKTLVLQDWIGEVPLQEIENRYGVWAGGVERIGEAYSRLCQALARFCAAFGWEREWCRAIERLAERLLYGVQEDALPVARLKVSQAARSELKRLREAGCLTPEAVRADQAEAGAQSSVRSGGMPSGVAAEPRTPAASAFAAAKPKEAPTPRGPSVASTLAHERGVGPPTTAKSTTNARAHHGADLVVDLALRKATLWGVEFPLQPQLFDALTALALRPGEVVSMAEIADQLQRLGRLERKPVAPEAPDLRYRLLRSMRAVLKRHRKSHGLGDLVQTVARSGLRLNCSAEVMRNRDELVD